jgi:hypothetical protein
MLSALRPLPRPQQVPHILHSSPSDDSLTKQKQAARVAAAVRCTGPVQGQLEAWQSPSIKDSYAATHICQVKPLCRHTSSAVWQAP